MDDMRLRKTIRDHLAKMPELANPPNTDLSKGNNFDLT